MHLFILNTHQDLHSTSFQWDDYVSADSTEYVWFSNLETFQSGLSIKDLAPILSLILDMYHTNHMPLSENIEFGCLIEYIQRF